MPATANVALSSRIQAWMKPSNELHVQSRGGFRFGMPLHADAEPAGVDRFDSLDDAVGGLGGNTQAAADLAHGLMMLAVDEDFAVAVKLVHASAGLQQHGVTVRPLAGGIVVRQRLRLIFRQMQEQGAAAAHVDLMHAHADAEHRHLPFEQHPHRMRSLSSRRSAIGRTET